MTYSLLLATREGRGGGQILAAAIHGDDPRTGSFTPAIISAPCHTFYGLVSAVVATFPATTFGGCREVIVPMRSMNDVLAPLGDFEFVYPHAFLSIAKSMSRFYQVPLTRFHLPRALPILPHALGESPDVIAARMLTVAIQKFRRVHSYKVDLPPKDDRLARLLDGALVFDEDLGTLLSPYDPAALQLIAQEHADREIMARHAEARFAAMLTETGG